MESVVSPVWFYLCLAAGGLGVLLSLPRPKVSPQVLGGLMAAVAFGLIFLLLGLRANQSGQAPTLYFYLFSFIGLGSALRVISHPRPVYAALYFILTILSSSALYLLAGAEFLAFALIIIYAGAILITYLFVIMLATQAPTEDQLEALSSYDAYSREPVVATALGFALLAVLSGMLARGINEVQPANAGRNPDALLVEMPKKIIRGLDRRGAFPSLQAPARDDELAFVEAIDIANRSVTMTIANADAFRASLDRREFRELVLPRELDPERSEEAVEILRSRATDNAQINIFLPADIAITNIDRIGWALIAGHPMALELAGVILLMAMLGAVVLARKQIEIGESEKIRALQTLSDGPPGGVM